MKYRVSWAKVEMVFDDIKGTVTMESPKIFGTDKSTVSIAQVRKACYGLGTLATLGCGIEWGSGQSHWVPAAYKGSQRDAQALVQAIGRSPGFRAMTAQEVHPFIFGFTRAPLPPSPAVVPQGSESLESIGVIVSHSVTPPIPPAPTSDGWYPDPWQRHQLRYAKQGSWTPYVSDAGIQTVDETGPVT